MAWRHFKSLGHLTCGAGPFDISAKLRVGVTKAQFLLMVQDLLAERFHLAYHSETKEMPVYEMAVSRAGLKFKENPEPDDSTGVAGAEAPRMSVGSNGYPELPPEFRGAVFMGARARLQLPHGTMDELVDMLAVRLARPVVNATGLDSAYRISVYWEMDDVVAGTPLSGATENAGAAVPQAVRGPSLADALEEQLGLKLVARKEPVRVLIVDHVDRSPTEN